MKINSSPGVGMARRDFRWREVGLQRLSLAQHGLGEVGGGRLAVPGLVRGGVRLVPQLSSPSQLEVTRSDPVIKANSFLRMVLCRPFNE